MGRRQKQSPLQDMLDIAAWLPWQISVPLALISYFLLHHLATRPVPAAHDAAELGQSAGLALYGGLARLFQYVLPLILVVGAILSAKAGFRRRKRFEVTRSLGTKSALLDMSWQQFEGLVGEYFRRKGYAVTVTGGKGPDGGVDVELSRDGERFLVQCKQWRATKVGVGVVRELYGAMAARGAAGGFVVTSGEFTAEARAFCEGRNIWLLDGDKLNMTMRTGSRVEPSATVARPVAPRVAPQAVPSCPKCQAPMNRRVAKQGPKAGESFWGCSRHPECYGIRPI